MTQDIPLSEGELDSRVLAGRVLLNALREEGGEPSICRILDSLTCTIDELRAAQARSDSQSDVKAGEDRDPVRTFFANAVMAPNVATCDLAKEIAKIDADFPNYGSWPIELPAGHWREMLAASPVSAACVPSAWVLFPREPTPEMIKAIEFAIYRYSDCNVRDAERGAPWVYAGLLAAYRGVPAPERHTPQSPEAKGWPGMP